MFWSCTWSLTCRWTVVQSDAGFSIDRQALKTLLRDQFLVDARPLTKTSGQPFKIAEIEAAIEETLA